MGKITSNLNSMDDIIIHLFIQRIDVPVLTFFQGFYFNTSEVSWYFYWWFNQDPVSTWLVSFLSR